MFCLNLALQLERQLADLIGLMIAFSPAFRYAEGYVKCLEIDKVEALNKCFGDFNAQMQLSEGF